MSAHFYEVCIMYLKYSLFLLIFPILTYADPDQIVAPPKGVKIMQPQTEEKNVRAQFRGMAEAYSFTSNPNNKCTAPTPGDFCYIQLSTPTIGATTTSGTNGCPDNYSAVLAFGNKVYTEDTGQIVVFMQGDAHARVSQNEKFFYESKGYTCPADTSASLLSQRISGGDDENTIKSWVGTVRNINSNYMSVTGYNSYGRQCLGPLGAVLTDWSCTSSAGTGHWVYTFDIYGYPLKCIRSAGFWLPNPATPTYPMAAPGTDFTPTTAICAKSYIVWREKK